MYFIFKGVKCFILTLRVRSLQNQVFIVHSFKKKNHGNVNSVLGKRLISGLSKGADLTS